MLQQLNLNYGKKFIRALACTSGLWIAASDIYAANRLWTDRDCLARLAPEHLQLRAFPSDSGPVQLAAVSPLGALTIAKYLPPTVGRIVDAWTRREASRLADEIGFPPLGMDWLADRTLPLKPRVSSDLYPSWKDLERIIPKAKRLPPDWTNPALADEDTNVGPDTGTARGTSIADLIAAGEAAIARDAETLAVARP
jgi:hypothetical protein